VEYYWKEQEMAETSRWHQRVMESIVLTYNHLIPYT